jgi:hypothetical protein
MKLHTVNIYYIKSIILIHSVLPVHK